MSTFYSFIMFYNPINDNVNPGFIKCYKPLGCLVGDMCHLIMKDDEN